MRTLLILLLIASTASAQDVYLGLHGGTWGEEPNFGGDIRLDYHYLTANAGYVFALTEKETFHASIGAIPYQNDWFKTHFTWGVVINDRQQAKFMWDVWFKVAHVTWVTAGIQSVQNNPYFNVGFACNLQGIFKKRTKKHPRFY